MKLYTLNDWLQWITQQASMQLGLERIMPVAERLSVLKPLCPLVIVGGTNGKGSTVAGLEALYLQAGYQVGVFTSPFLFKFNEEVRINGKAVADEALILAFEAIEQVRGDISLTPFEYHTLAALWLFQHRFKLHLWILEVGLGGRLDAVNILNADLAIITSIDFDHTEWLGESREEIAFEKAGIFRDHQMVVCGERIPPATLLCAATDKQVKWFGLGQEFDFVNQGSNWQFRSNIVTYDDLPLPRLAIQNMATVLMAVSLLQDKLPLSLSVIYEGMAKASLIGRLQVLPGEITTIYDVSHNPASVQHLANFLQQNPCAGKTIAVFSMFADKDILNSVKCIKAEMDEWHVAPINHTRGATLQILQKCFAEQDIKNIKFSASLTLAFSQAKASAKVGDRIVIFGSFHTVAELYDDRSTI